MRLLQALIFATACVLPAFVFAQGKLPSVGLLWNDSVKPSPYAATLLGAFKEKGLVENRDFRVEDRISLEGYGDMTRNAADLVRAHVSVIVAYGTTATRAAAEATTDIPIVMITGVDPAGLTMSLARPVTNVTGVYMFTQELVGKRVQLLKEMVPGLSRVGVLVTPDSSASAILQREMESAAQSLGLKTKSAEVRGPQDLEGAFVDLSQSKVSGLIVPGSTMLAAHRARVAALAGKHRLPAIYAGSRFVDAGGLMSYGPNFEQAFVRAAGYVDRLLKGARVSDLPFERVSRFELVINVKTAKALGLTVPQSVLVRADRVIE